MFRDSTRSGFSPHFTTIASDGETNAMTNNRRLRTEKLRFIFLTGRQGAGGKTLLNRGLQAKEENDENPVLSAGRDRRVRV